MLCPDYTNLSIIGDFNSAQFSRPSIVFKIPSQECRDDPYDIECVASKEYEETWSTKGILMLHNRKRFDQLEYQNNPIILESVFHAFELPKTN